MINVAASEDFLMTVLEAQIITAALLLRELKPTENLAKRLYMENKRSNKAEQAL